jgi:hypothetical protein
MNTLSFSRSDYGVLTLTRGANSSDCEFFRSASAMVRKAEQGKKIPRSFDDMYWGSSGKEKHKRIGDALYHEIYDISPNSRSVLMCARSVTGNRYGQRTTDKSYFLIRVHGKGVRVVPANKALAAKGAKTAVELGDAIAIVTGKATYLAPANKVRLGYKLVTRNDDGELVSVWDGSSWALGKTRIEAATEGHRGGFYYYESKDKALSAAVANETFGNARRHNNLVLIEVEASGRHIFYGNEKLCASRIRPIREVSIVE